MTLFQDNEAASAMTNILLNVGGSLLAVLLASQLVQFLSD